MPRKIQRKPVRYSIQKKPSEERVPRDLDIQAAVTVVGGTTGLFVAILWLAGRFYASGYFGAMNIPAFQISFSIWEYAEASWLKLIFYFLSKIYLPLAVIAAVAFIILLISFILQRIFPKLKLADALKKIALEAEKFQRSSKGILAFSLVMYFIYILLLVFIEINKSGKYEGRDAVLTESYAVEVYSRDGIPLGAGQAKTNRLSTLNHYTGFRLLTYNNGKYYLFRDIDPATCKPLQVFVISDTQDIYFVFGGIAPINTPCDLTSIP